VPMQSFAYPAPCTREPRPRTTHPLMHHLLDAYATLGCICATWMRMRPSDAYAPPLGMHMRPSDAYALIPRCLYVHLCTPPCLSPLGPRVHGPSGAGCRASGTGYTPAASCSACAEELGRATGCRVQGTGYRVPRVRGCRAPCASLDESLDDLDDVLVRREDAREKRAPDEDSLARVG